MSNEFVVYSTKREGGDAFHRVSDNGKAECGSLDTHTIRKVDERQGIVSYVKGDDTVLSSRDEAAEAGYSPCKRCFDVRPREDRPEVSDLEWLRAVRQFSEDEGKDPKPEEVGKRVGRRRRRSEYRLKELYNANFLTRSKRIQLSEPGENPYTYHVPESEPPIDDESEIWIVSNPNTDGGKRYHIKTDCGTLAEADKIVQKRFGLLYDSYELCKRCGGEIGPTPYVTERDCPVTGCDDTVENLPNHLKYDHSGGGD